MSRVRRFIARAVFLGIGATQNGCCCTDEDIPTHRAVVEITEPSPALADVIARCKAGQDDCGALCDAALASFTDDFGLEIVDCTVSMLGPGAQVTISYVEDVACGRAPLGLVARSAVDGDDVAQWLARAAYLEAASVVAFVHLAADLARLGAPRALVEAALVAASDEVRHAAAIRALVAIPIPAVRALPYRPLALHELALHNAIEGCVRETVGAAINLWQAQTATDPTLRAVFAQIATDEIAHAELSWRIDAWASEQLTDAQRAAIADARRAALVRLLDGDIGPRDPRLGLPDAGAVRSLARVVDQLV